MKNLNRILVVVVFAIAMFFNTLESDNSIFSFATLTTLNKANAQNGENGENGDKKSHSKAVEKPLYSTTTKYYYNPVCNCLSSYTSQSQSGAYWCCTPATVQDRCNASLPDC